MTSQTRTSECTTLGTESEGEADVLISVRTGVDGRSPYSAARTWLKKNVPDAGEIVTIGFGGRPENGVHQILMVTYKVAQARLDG
jgi:hypothetical protein